MYINIFIFYKATYSSLEQKPCSDGVAEIRPSYSMDNVKSNRHMMLHMIKTKLRLSPTQAKVKHPSNEHARANREVSKFEFDPLLENCPKISLPLPLPDMYGEWGVATLFLRFKPSDLLILEFYVVRDVYAGGRNTI